LPPPALPPPVTPTNAAAGGCGSGSSGFEERLRTGDPSSALPAGDRADDGLAGDVRVLVATVARVTCHEGDPATRPD
ncbi:hypothetical protein, partial [Modestobacter excelsi]|uniref:hypothetical protein n=1 Tax=Modestobacter excelsi TaxID=2213161 RepID=UPI001C20E99E